MSAPPARYIYGTTGGSLTTHVYSGSRLSYSKGFLPPRETSLNLGERYVDRLSTRGVRDETLHSLAHFALAMPCIAGERPRRYAVVDTNSWDM